MRLEADLGDIIYVLAIVVFGIIGALGKGKKKKRPFMPEAEESTEPTFWEELKKEMQGKEEEEVFVPVQEEVHQQPEVVAGQQQPIISSPLEHRKSYTYSREQLKNESVEYADVSSEIETDGITKRKPKNAKNGLKLNLNSIDELKKGIIYTEIFNRKYV